MTVAAATGPNRIGRNAAFSYSSQLWLLGLGFVSTPITLRYLGDDGFGVWMTVSVVTSYFTILDLGLPRAVVKFLAEYWSKGEYRDAERVIRSANLLFLVLATVGAISVSVFGHLLARYILHIPSELHGETSLAFGLASLSFFVNMASAPMSAIPMAVQRFEYVAGRLVLTATLTTLGSIALLIAGFGLVELLAYAAVVNTVAALVFGVMVSRLVRGTNLLPSLHRRTVSQLGRFSAFKFMSTVSDQVVFQADRLLVAAFLPIASVTFYSVPAVIMQRVLPFVGHVTNAAFPAMSAAAAAGDQSDTRRAYLRSVRLASLSILPVCLFCGIMARPFLDGWAGADLAEHSTRTLEVFSLAVFVAALAGSPAMANEALGRPQVTTAFALVSAALNLGFNLALIPLLGYEGSAWALLANACIQVPLFVVVTNHGLGVPNRTWFRTAVIGPAGAALPSSAVLVIARLAAPGLLVVLATGACFIALYALFAYRIALSESDRASVDSTIKEVWKACRSLGSRMHSTTTRVAPTALAGESTREA